MDAARRDAGLVRLSDADTVPAGDLATNDESPSMTTSRRAQSVERPLSRPASLRGLRRSLSWVEASLRGPASPSRPQRMSSAGGIRPQPGEDSQSGAAAPADAADVAKTLSPKRVVEHARKLHRRISNGGLQRFDFVSDANFRACAARAPGALTAKRGGVRDRRGSALLLQRHVRAHLAKLRAKQLRREARRIRLGLRTIADVIGLEAEEREIEGERKRLVAAENTAMNDHHVRERMKALLGRSDIAVALQTQTHGYALGEHHHFCHTRTRAFRSRIAKEHLTTPAAERTEHRDHSPTGWIRTTRALIRVGDGARAHTMTVAEFRFLAAEAISHERQVHSDAMWRMERAEQRLQWERSRAADHARWATEDAAAVRQHEKTFSPARTESPDSSGSSRGGSGGTASAFSGAPPRANDQFSELQQVDDVYTSPPPRPASPDESAGEEGSVGDSAIGSGAEGGPAADAAASDSATADGGGIGNGAEDTPVLDGSTSSMDAAVSAPSSKAHCLLGGAIGTSATSGQGEHRRLAERALSDVTKGQFGHGEHRAAAKHALQVAMNKGASLLMPTGAKENVVRSAASKLETGAVAPRVPPVAAATITLVSRGVVLDDDSASAFELRLFEPSVTLIALQEGIAPMTYVTAVVMVQRHFRERVARRAAVNAPRPMSFRLARLVHDAGVKEHVSALKAHGYGLGAGSRRMSFGIGPGGTIRIVPESAAEQAERERRVQQEGSQRRGIDVFNAKLTRVVAHVVRFLGFDSSAVCVVAGPNRAGCYYSATRTHLLARSFVWSHPPTLTPFPPRTTLTTSSYEGKNTRLHDFISNDCAMDAIQQLETFGNSECRDAVTVPNAKGDTPLHLIADQVHCHALGMLRLAAKLLELGANPNAADFDIGETPLHRACRIKGAKGLVFVHLLLSHGADLAATDFCGWTPLHVACANGCTKVASHLIREGARLDSVTRTPRVGHLDPLETPLHFAAMAGDVVAVAAIVQKMAQHGMDLSVKCAAGNNGHLRTSGAAPPGVGGAAEATVWTAMDCVKIYGAENTSGDGAHLLVEAALREKGVLESASEQVRRGAMHVVTVTVLTPPPPPPHVSSCPARPRALSTAPTLAAD